jgi:4-alpha-glucanotransferase
MQLARGSGILLHPTSLPGPHGSGDLGEDAERFVAWLERAGQRYWQVLPLSPVGYGNSPYSSLSAFATSPTMIDLRGLVRRGLLEASEVPATTDLPARRIDFNRSSAFRLALLRRACDRFFARATPPERDAFEAFTRSHAAWLADYALFMALNDAHGGVEWSRWERDLARREPAALAEARRTLAADVRFHEFTQWVFFDQWAKLRKLANDRNIKLIGDIPIFVAYHSADVWARPELFHLDAEGRPMVVAGVPPDYFSATGQRWGNPLYRWDKMAAEGYAWWVDRFRAVFELVDVARLDHFRGFAAYWEIPEAEATAVKGTWVLGPGAALFEAVRTALGQLPIIAEDLGVITPDVSALRDAFEFPGMKVLQFAFGGGPENAFLPHNYTRNGVVYTGTHDNDTTRGWFETATEPERHFVRRYLGTDAREINWDFIRLASQSVADVAIFPFQDVLGLGAEGRMNRPGLASGNWDWRFTWDEVPVDAATRLGDLARLSGRLL